MRFARGPSSRGPRLLRAAAKLAALAALCALLPSTARASAEPLQAWRTLRTECCDIHYPADIEEKARRVAGHADGAVAVTSALVGSPPSERLQIVLSDATDSFNGFATVLPYNLVHLFAVPPDGEHEFSRAEDWLRTVLVHEVLHVVHLDTVHGLPAFVNLVLGKQWPPNFAQPRWIIEGMATYAESTRTTGGRLRSSRWDSYLRLAALEGDLWSLDDLSNYSRRPPGGGAAYLYGAHFLAFLAERHGEELFRGITHDYGGRVVPYQLQRSFRESAGIDLDQEWEAFLEALRQDAEATRAAVVARGGPTKVRRLTRIGAVRSPRFDDDGALLFVASSPNESDGLYALRGLPALAPAPAPIAELNDSGEVTPDRPGSIIVSQTEVWWGHWSFRDLFRLSPGRPPERLTDGARVRRPARIPGTRELVAEHRTGEATSLVRVHADTGAVTELRRFDEGVVGYTPRPSPDGRYVVYSRLELDGARDLWEIDLASLDERRLTTGPEEDTDPTYTPDGRWIVYAADKGGVFNLWALERATGREVRVTDVLGSATSPEVTPDGRAVVFIGETLAGEDLFVAPLRLPDGGAEPPVAEDVPVTTEQTAAEPAPSAALDAEDQRRPSEPYNPLLTLWPHNWLPVLTTDARDGPAVGIALEGKDAVETHSWAAQATWGFGLQRPRVSLAWRFLDLYFPVTLSGEWRTDVSDAIRRNEGEREEHVETVLRGGVTVALPVRRWRRNHSFNVGYARELHLVETPVTAHPDGVKPVYPPSGNIGSLTLSYGYSDTRRFRDSVSTEEGFAFVAGARIANELTLSELDLYEFTTELRLFARVPGLSNHVVATYLTGGAAFGERLRRANWRIGGLEDRDVVQDLVDGARFGAGYLRGYPAGFDIGDGYFLATLEYRLPLVEIERGFSTLPLAFTRLHGAVFTDLGDAFDGIPNARALKVGVGAELRLEALVGYYASLLVRVGYARGLMPGGVDQPYVVVGVPY